MWWFCNSTPREHRDSRCAGAEIGLWLCLYSWWHVSSWQVPWVCRFYNHIFSLAGILGLQCVESFSALTATHCGSCSLYQVQMSFSDLCDVSSLHDVISTPPQNLRRKPGAVAKSSSWPIRCSRALSISCHHFISYTSSTMTRGCFVDDVNTAEGGCTDSAASSLATGFENLVWKCRNARIAKAIHSNSTAHDVWFGMGMGRFVDSM